MDPEIVLRPITAKDRDFLLRVYGGTRAEEMALTGWNKNQQAAFLRQQFEAQHAYYQEHFADARFDVILRGDEPIGRLYVARWDEELRVIDIALLPQHRRAGIGSSLLRTLIDEAHAASKPVRIHVEHNNPALGLYRRLGFRETGDTGVYYLMQCAPEGTA